MIILDCGTGARPLGLDILSRDDELPPIDLLVTHTHWDHIQGFPFFLPAYVPGGRLTIYGPRGLEQTLEASLAGQMRHTYFPVQLGQLRADVEFVELAEERFTLGGCRVSTQLLNHTATTIGYRFDTPGLRVAYLTDHEPFWWPGPRQASGPGPLSHPGEERHMAFMAGADLVIHDAQYSDREYPAKRGWGHSPVEYVTDVAADAGVKRLVLFHHDPLHSDAWVRQHTELARRRARARGSTMEIVAAAEGVEIDVPEGSDGAAGDMHLVPSGRVLLAGSSADAVREVREILGPDGYDLAAVRESQAAAAIARCRPGLVVLVGARTEAAWLEVVRSIRAQPAGGEIPILVLAGSEGPGGAGRLADPLTDVVSRPYNPAILRPRVRAWLSRTGTSVAGRTSAPPARAARAAPARGLLRGLPFAERATLLTGALSTRFREGETVFREGDPAGGFYFIRSGQVRLSVNDGDGREVVVATAGAGDTLGELAALDGGPRTATARAVSAVTADYVPPEMFAAALGEAPAAAARLLRLMAERLRSTDRYPGELLSTSPQLSPSRNSDGGPRPRRRSPRRRGVNAGRPQRRSARTRH